ncbi:MAG: hypothetical protein QM737_13055 [Ferruginibacter sp.]
MKMFKASFFGILLVLSGYNCLAQKVSLVEKSFKCVSCGNLKPKAFTIKDADPLLVNEHSLLSAVKKIKPYFTYPGDHFILACDDCPGRKTLGYIVEEEKSSSQKGFGTFIYSSGSGKTKGSDVFYKFSDLLTFIQDSILIFDSVQLSVALMVDKDPAILNTLRAGFLYKDKMRERIIPYDEAKQLINISYKTLFGDKLDRSITDTIDVHLIYYNAANERTLLPGSFKIYFATTEEKKIIADMFAMYKTTFPEWTTEQVAEELIPVVTGKYKNVSEKNFINWLKSLPQN